MKPIKQIAGRRRKGTISPFLKLMDAVSSSARHITGEQLARSEMALAMSRKIPEPKSGEAP